MSKYLKISLVFILVLLTGCGTVTKGNNIVKTKTESTEQQWANEVTATIDAAGNVTVISENVRQIALQMLVMSIIREQIVLL